MHNTLYALLIALTNNIDNIGARIAFSIKGIRITLWINLWISVITFIISTASAYVGEILLSLINVRMCSYISMVLLIGIGVWFIIEPRIKHKKDKGNPNVILDILDNPEEADINKSKDIDFKEATLLGIALSINNIGGSLSAGMIGINTWMVGGLSAAINFIALWAGNYLSAYFQRFKLKEKSALISGIILILIGIKQIL